MTPRAVAASGRKKTKKTKKIIPARRAKQQKRTRLPKVDVSAQIRILKRLYPGARCTLDYRSPFELLVATILSAQCTDERVNKVTPSLFARYPDPRSFAEVELPELEEAIRSTGFFRAKSKALKACARDLVEKHGSQVPADLESLVALRGVGRKTANVVLGNAFGVPGVVVDTHVTRVARRLGLTASVEPARIEQDLMKRVPRREWTLFSHLLIHHGRAVCKAPRPRCAECALAEHCPKVGVPGPIRAAAPAFRPT